MFRGGTAFVLDGVADLQTPFCLSRLSVVALSSAVRQFSTHSAFCRLISSQGMSYNQKHGGL